MVGLGSVDSVCEYYQCPYFSQRDFRVNTIHWPDNMTLFECFGYQESKAQCPFNTQRCLFLAHPSQYCEALSSAEKSVADSVSRKVTSCRSSFQMEYLCRMGLDLHLIIIVREFQFEKKIKASQQINKRETMLSIGPTK